MLSFVVHADRRWRNKELVRERDERKTRSMWLVAVGMFLAAAPIGVCMWQQNECLKLSYAVEELRAEHERLLETERRLKIERAAGESLPAVERWATRRHGLARPGSGQVLVVPRASAESGALMARGFVPD